MREMLTLRRKMYILHLIVTYTYRQTDRVAMGSPLGPVLAGIIMLCLERSA